ncbi:MAG: hypothetical protein NT029_01090 [Armatimonadetes bacterium]|nr:hypothetical protein [Armatimonadota bacterium]
MLRLPWQRTPGPWMWEPAKRRRFMFPEGWSESRRSAQGWALLGVGVGISLVVYCRDAPGFWVWRRARPSRALCPCC